MEKVSFIMCVNNRTIMEENIFYLNHLKVPSDMEIEIIPIWGAKSMASGYNEGMHKSEANYKIYLHQDTRIINPDFLENMRSYLKNEDEIGLMGVIGLSKVPNQGTICQLWDTGHVQINVSPFVVLPYGDEFEGKYKEVECLDGLLLITQYDVPFREDLFDGWDFYDASLCQEYIKRGYKVIVPQQERLWCWHDNDTSNYKEYDRYRNIFGKEYKNNSDWDFGIQHGYSSEFEELMRQLIKALEQLCSKNNWDAIVDIYNSFENINMINTGTFLAKVYILMNIYKAERLSKATNLFCQKGETLQTLIEKLDLIKYSLKRLQYGFEELPNEFVKLMKENKLSNVAIETIMLSYGMHIK